MSSAAAHALLLVTAGVLLLTWVPDLLERGRTPRTTTGLVLLGAVAVWFGSLGFVVGVIAGPSGGPLLTACGQVWTRLTSEGLGWWESLTVITWVVLLPARAAARAIARVRGSRHLLERLHVAGERRPASGEGHTEVTTHTVLVVPALRTPAITLGVLRPVVVVDATFWAEADPIQRRVVLSHEQAHRSGRHIVIELASSILSAGLSPVADAAHLRLRRQLEALADDRAAGSHGRLVVARTVAAVALEAPAQAAHHAGLGALGNTLWRVRRLLSGDSGAHRWVVAAAATAAVVGVVLVDVILDATSTVVLGTMLDFCLV